MAPSLSTTHHFDNHWTKVSVDIPIHALGCFHTFNCFLQMFGCCRFSQWSMHELVLVKISLQMYNWFCCNMPKHACTYPHQTIGIFLLHVLKLIQEHMLVLWSIEEKHFKIINLWMAWRKQIKFMFVLTKTATVASFEITLTLLLIKVIHSCSPRFNLPYFNGEKSCYWESIQ